MVPGVVHISFFSLRFYTACLFCSKASSSGQFFFFLTSCCVPTNLITQYYSFLIQINLIKEVKKGIRWSEALLHKGCQFRNNIRGNLYE